MNRTLLTILIHLLAASCATAGHAATATATAVVTEVKAAPVYVLVKEKSSLKFTATQNNAPVEGKFTGFEADIAFDPEHVGLSHINVEVDLNSLVLADSQTRETLLTADWLGVVAHPKAVFTSEKIDRIPGTKDYYALGNLKLNGASAPVTLNFSMDFMDESSAVASGYVTLQRTDFGVGKGDWSRDDVVKKAVRVEFRVTATKKP